MFDPMVAKLIVWDNDREQATKRMLRALAEYKITGLVTLLPFHRAILATEQWRRGESCRDLLSSKDWLASIPSEPPAPKGKAGEANIALDYTVEVSGRRFDVKVIGPPSGAITPEGAPLSRPRRTPRERSKAAGPADDLLTSPMQGTVLKLAIETGAQVQEGALIAIVEAMKMENEITAHKSGTVAELHVSVGGAVGAGDPVVVITDE